MKKKKLPIFPCQTDPIRLIWLRWWKLNVYSSVRPCRCWWVHAKAFINSLFRQPISKKKKNPVTHVKKTLSAFFFCQNVYFSVINVWFWRWFVCWFSLKLLRPFFSFFFLVKYFSLANNFRKTAIQTISPSTTPPPPPTHPLLVAGSARAAARLRVKSFEQHDFKLIYTSRRESLVFLVSVKKILFKDEQRHESHFDLN